ncbi:hypothetical protein ACLBQR_31665, partial [Klebsiella pneumoniae]
ESGLKTTISQIINYTIRFDFEAAKVKKVDSMSIGIRCGKRSLNLVAAGDSHTGQFQLVIAIIPISCGSMKLLT